MENDGEVELSEQTMLQNYSESSSNVQASLSDSFFDEFLKSSQTCTHTHTCNSPGPEFSHSHTCFHTHTHFIPSEIEKIDGYDSLQEKKIQALKPKRVPGNREAVRKYREKKKAQTVYLEEEVKKLRFLNTQLVKKVQRQAVLEREILRLRSVFVSLKGKIDNELGDFPFLKQNGCNVQDCERMSNFVVLEGNCQSPSVDCQAKVNGPSLEDMH